MAGGYVAEIKVLFDIQGSGKKGGADAPATAGGGGTGASGASAKGLLDEIRAEFKELASHVKAVSAGMKDLSKLFGSAKKSQRAAPEGEGPGDKGTGEKAAAAEREAAASKEAADAAKKAATIKETEAKAAEEYVAAAKKAVESTDELAEAVRKAAEGDSARAKAIAHLNKAQGETRAEGKLSPVAKFEGLLRGIATSPEFQKSAGELEDNVRNMFRFGPGVTSEMRERTRELGVNFSHDIRKAMKAIESGTVTRETFSKLQQKLNEGFRGLQEDTGGEGGNIQGW